MAFVHEFIVLVQKQLIPALSDDKEPLTAFEEKYHIGFQYPLGIPIDDTSNSDER